MHRRIRTTVAALLCAVLFVSLLQRPAYAKPDGKTSTYEIIVGGALIGYLLKLGVDNGKANRNAGNAMDLMKSSEADLQLLKDPATPADLPPPTARGLRTALLAAVHDDTKSALREQYEVLRDCWNSLIVSPPISADAAKKPLLTFAQVTASAPPAGTPALTGCSALRKAVSNQFVDSRVDLYDAYVAFTTAPSLFQQIIDLNVGSHVADNTIRIRTVYLLGENFLGFRVTPSKPPFASVSVKDVFASCVTNKSPFDCIAQISAAEASAAAAHRTAVACRFARETWLPSYSAVKTASHIADDAEFAGVPGC